MRLNYAWPLSLCLGVSSGFRDTSPFFAFSTLDGDFVSPLRDSVVKSTDVDYLIKEIARACHTDAFVIVTQPGVSAEDYGSKDAAPSLRRRLEAAKSRKSYMIKPDVLGEVHMDQMLKELVTTCGMAERNVNGDERPLTIPDSYPQVLKVDLVPPHPHYKRQEQLSENDRIVNAILEGLEDHSHTVLYFTTPVSAEGASTAGSENRISQQHPLHLYDFDAEDHVPEAYHSDLKRDLDSHVARQARNASSSSGAPLFEKYNFFSPGIFMGLLASFLLLTILYVGISAIGGMEVSYGAFSKEMGPSAQKKQ